MGRKEIEDEYCRLRQMAFGLQGCHNCPIACAVQSNNLNVFENFKTEMEELEKHLKKTVM